VDHSDCLRIIQAKDMEWKNAMITLLVIIWSSFIDAVYHVRPLPDIWNTRHALSIVLENDNGIGAISMKSSLDNRMINSTFSGSPPIATFTFNTTEAGMHNITFSSNGAVVAHKSLWVVPDVLTVGTFVSDDEIQLTLSVLVLADILNEDPEYAHLMNLTKVNVVYERSNCDVSTASKSMNSFVNVHNVIAIDGPDCSVVGKVVGAISSGFHIPMISGMCGSTLLSNKAVYPYFMRTIGTSKDDAGIAMAMIRYFNWTYVNVIDFDEYPIDESFYTMLKESNVTLGTKFAFGTGTTDFNTELQIIKESGVNIIFCSVYNGVGDSNDFDTLFLQAHQKGLLGTDYVWVLFSTAANSMRSSDQVKHLNPNVLVVGIGVDKGDIKLGSKLIAAYNNLNVTARGWPDLPKPSSNPWVDFNTTEIIATEDYYTDNTVTYADAYLAIYYALQNILYRDRVPLDGPTLLEYMMTNVFVGTGGVIKFDANGDRPGIGIVENLINTTFIQNGRVSFLNSEKGEIHLDIPIRWPSDGHGPLDPNKPPPKSFRCNTGCGHGYCDEPLKCHCEYGWVRNETLYESGGDDCTVPLCRSCIHGKCTAPDVCTCNQNYLGADCSILSLPQVSMDSGLASVKGYIGLNAICMLIVILTIALLQIFESKPNIKALSIRITQIMLFGALIGQIGGFLQAVTPTDVTCQSSMILHLFGFTILLSSILVKTWRIYFIFGSPRLNSASLITDKKLLFMILRYCLVTMILFALWVGLDPPKAKVIKDIDPENFYLMCSLYTNVPGNVLFVLSISYLALMLIGIILLAIATRSVPGKFKDANFVAALSYNILLIGIVCFAFSIKPIYGGAAAGQLILMYGPMVMYVLTPVLLVWPRMIFVVRDNDASRDTTSMSRASQFIDTKQVRGALGVNSDAIVISNTHRLEQGFFSRWQKEIAVYDKKQSLVWFVNYGANVGEEGRPG
jgi:ABC-type branched-subunit amino acid transport system substrate-binding protein